MPLTEFKVFGKFLFNNATPDAQETDSRSFLNRNQLAAASAGYLNFKFGEGGPMFVKNKAFFFFNYEGFRLAQQVSAAQHAATASETAIYLR